MATVLCGDYLFPDMSDTVLPSRGMKSTPHMNAIGLVIAAGIALVLLPVLPLLVVMYLLGRHWGSSVGPSYQREEPTTDVHGER